MGDNARKKRRSHSLNRINVSFIDAFDGLFIIPPCKSDERAEDAQTAHNCTNSPHGRNKRRNSGCVGMRHYWLFAVAAHIYTHCTRIIIL